MHASLPLGGEETLEQLGGAPLADTAIDLRRVMAGGLRKEARAGLDGAAFRIGRAQIKPAEAGEGHGGGAHGARLERHVEVASGQPLTAELCASLADREQLRM